MRKLVRKSKKSNWKTIAWAIFFAFIFIWIFIILAIKTNIFKWNNWSNNSSSSSSTWDVNQVISWNYIWNEVSKEWLIEANTWFWFGSFTHYLIVDWEKQFWLKSSEVDLWVMSWNIAIKWKIVDYKENIPVVDVKEAISLQPWDSITDELSWNDAWRIVTNYNYGRYMLKIDFWEISDYVASIEKWIIVITKTTSSSSSKSISWTILQDNKITISPFECEKWSPTLDCQALKDTFKKLKYDSFKSSDWIEFFKIAEWKKWAFFNEDIFWYYVNANDDKDFLNISSYIDLISTQDIKLRLNPYVWTVCKDSKTKMKTMDNLKLIIEKSTLIWVLSWTDINKNQLFCKIQISLWETLETRLVDFYISWKSASSNSSTSSTVVDIKPQVVLSWDSLSWKMLVYTPKNWAWQLYLPKKLAYKWAQGNDAVDFWLPWFECYQKVIAINYKSQENLDKDPTIRVYSCITNHDDNTIKWLIEPKSLIYLKWQKSDKKFLIEYKDEESRVLAEQMILY